MFQSTLALLKSRLESLRFSERKSKAPIRSTSGILTEGAPVVAEKVSLQPSASDQPGVRYERKMGNSELSYYLPSRANGVNDMYALSLAHMLAIHSNLFRYLHLGFKAPTHIMERERVRVVWAILRQRHPLLAATVEMRDYDDVRFV
jgi:hypothetical protein